MKLIGTAFVLLSMMACSTVTIREQGTAKLTTEPTWSQSENFFLWGLVGTANVDVKQVCRSQTPVQLQAQNTFVDGLLNVVTIGIYAPRTAKVWCE